MAAVARSRLVETLQRALQAIDDVDAAWEGGSAAFGSDDALSDVDAVAVVADDAIASTFAGVEAALERLSPIALRYDVPPAPGFAQKFYRLRDAGEFLVVDLALMRRGDPLLFREVELHGRGVVWFDRRGILAAEARVDAAADLEQARARIEALAAAFEMFQHLAVKERLRGHPADALAFYQGMTWRPLVEALRLLHCPQRRAFGPRYLRRDLPADACHRVEALGYVRDLADLGDKQAAARAWFGRCIARLRAHGPGSGLVD